MSSNTSQNIPTGKKGERLAVALLREKGYLILERNYRVGRYELDVICRKDETLVIVEVKTRQNNEFGAPEDAVDSLKEHHIRTAAEEYIHRIQWTGPVRLDIIAIILGEDEDVHHIEDAFF